MNQNSRTKSHRVAKAPFLLGVLLLGGCKTFSPDGGLDVTARIAANEIGKEVVAVRSAEAALVVDEQVRTLLSRPLTADTAVQIALFNNRGLQAAYNELGLAETQLISASLPPNPTFSVERLSSTVEIEIEKRIIGNILALATLPLRSEIASERFRQAQLRAAAETIKVAGEARQSFYRAVAGRELVSFLTQAVEAANQAAQLAARLGQTGGINKLDQAREQVFYAELAAQLGRARQNASSERERLVRVLGLWGSDLNFRLPGALPPLPRRVQSAPFIEVEAVRRRLDLQIARIELDALAKSLRLTEATRFINLLELSGVRETKRERETGERSPRLEGFEVEFQIPIFDGGEVRVRQAAETYMQAVNHLLERAVNVRSEARDAYRVYRTAYDLAGHYRREILPLRKIISDEVLLRYNAMQIDVFALLAEARQRITATTAAIEAQRQFWLATVDLLGAVLVGGAPEARMASTAPGSAPADREH